VGRPKAHIVNKRYEILTSDQKTKFLDAFYIIRNSVQWKPGKDISHLEKRKRMRHLALTASLRDYHDVISTLVRNDQNIVYLYEFENTYYYAVRGFFQGNEWLVIFGNDGIIETAFPPEDIDHYLTNRGFVLLDRISEVLKWTKLVKN